MTSAQACMDPRGSSVLVTWRGSDPHSSARLHTAGDYISNDSEMYVLNKARLKTAKRSGVLHMKGSNSINPEVLFN